MEKCFFGLKEENIKQNRELPAFNNYKELVLKALDVYAIYIVCKETGIKKDDKVSAIVNQSDLVLLFSGKSIWGNFVKTLMHERKCIVSLTDFSIPNKNAEFYLNDIVCKIDQLFKENYPDELNNHPKEVLENSFAKHLHYKTRRLT